LGINGGVRPGYQDVSAVLLQNGKLVAAFEEERLTRVKHSPGVLPYHSIKAALAKSNLRIQDIDLVVSHGSTWGQEYGEHLRTFFQHYFAHIPQIERVHHHLAHGASAYYASGIDQCLVVTFDNSGDGVSTEISVGREGKLTKIKTYNRPQSLGLFYSVITQYCGFSRDSDEYKLMGLASYGNRDNDELNKIFDNFLCWDSNANEYVFDERVLRHIPSGMPQPSKQMPCFADYLIEQLGQPRTPGSQITQHYKDIAAVAQKKLEEVTLKMISYYLEKLNLRKICLAGGVALNCVLNQKIMNLEFVDEIFIQPAAGDSGISLGAAYLGSLEMGVPPLEMNHAYHGGLYTNDQIRKQLDDMSLTYRVIDDPSAYAANLVVQGQVIGWFQGASEYGPRALGARSILADPTRKGIQDIVNKKIKFRESFRPFCPSVLEEDCNQYFRGKLSKSPYMTITYDVTPQGQCQLAGVTHVDNTARIQTVRNNLERENPETSYYRYLTQLKKLNGHGVSLNTSFNRSNEPIVECPRDAISCFYGSGIDSLIIGNYLITKNKG
jgi:carbamoyltransferase